MNKRRFGIVALAPLLFIAAIACSTESEEGPSETAKNAPAGHAHVAVSFSREIAPLVAEHCSSCHREGGPGPFVFAKHADLSRRASQLAEVIESGFMPPWLPRSGEDLPSLLGQRGFTATEKKKLLTWLQSGAPLPEGEAPAIDLPATETWVLGPPDLIFETRGTFEVPAEGNAILHTLVFPLGLEQAARVRAIDFQPSEPAALHGASFLLDDTGLAERFDSVTPEAGYRSPAALGLVVPGSAGGWSPGAVPRELPGDAGWPVGPKTALSVQLHLNPRGKKESLTARVGIYLNSEESRRPLTTIAVGSLDIDIPAGVADHRIQAEEIVPTDADLISLFPLAHYVCQKVKVDATLPDGTRRALLRIDDYDMNWVEAFTFAQPLRLPAGTKLTMEIVYDNSAANPQNPNFPPQPVKLGHGATEETGFVLVTLAPTDPERLVDLEIVHREGFKKRQKARRRKR